MTDRDVSPGARLAGLAQRPSASRGRRFQEPEAAYRSAYQRDRDRIIHSRAVRRLEYKTQVFVNHEGDHYRTRLTHSIEVSQIGRTVARALGLDEDLVESLSLSHDLGHTPFGHLGEEVLRDRLREHGGFDHNRQTLRIVELLEERYPAFPGLNLTWEVREGIVKHTVPVDPASTAPEYEPGLRPPLEAQLIDLVDEIAYNHHDIDDGIESRLLQVDDLARSVPIFGEPLIAARRQYPGVDPRRAQNLAMRGVVEELVTDLIAHTSARLRDAAPASVDDVRAVPERLAGMSDRVKARNTELKDYLRERLYRHHRIERMKDKARRVLEALFDRYLQNPLLLPEDPRRRVAAEGLERTIADYIAGMTDRYAIREHGRLFAID